MSIPILATVTIATDHFPQAMLCHKLGRTPAPGVFVQMCTCLSLD